MGKGYPPKFFEQTYGSCQDDPIVVEDDLDDGRIPGSERVYEDEVIDEVEKTKDWVNDKDHSQFIPYIKDKLTKIPRHSGETVAGCERAKAFLKAVDSEISKGSTFYFTIPIA